MIGYIGTHCQTGMSELNICTNRITDQIGVMYLDEFPNNCTIKQELTSYKLFHMRHVINEFEKEYSKYLPKSQYLHRLQC